MEHVVPGSFDLATLPRPQGSVLPGQVQGVYITLHPDALEAIADKIAGWFEGREEVELIDLGTSDKAGLGFLLMEWSEYAIDPLFLAILRDEEAIADYTMYAREREE